MKNILHNEVTAEKDLTLANWGLCLNVFSDDNVNYGTFFGWFWNSTFKIIEHGTSSIMGDIYQNIFSSVIKDFLYLFHLNIDQLFKD